jgi:hypothetical protein
VRRRVLMDNLAAALPDQVQRRAALGWPAADDAQRHRQVNGRRDACRQSKEHCQPSPCSMDADLLPPSPERLRRLRWIHADPRRLRSTTNHGPEIYRVASDL